MPPALAQLPNAGSLDVTPFFGIAFGSDQEGPTTPIGVGIGYNRTDQIAFEGELGIVRDIEGDTSAADVGLLTFGANGCITSTRRRATSATRRSGSVSAGRPSTSPTSTRLTPSWR